MSSSLNVVPITLKQELLPKQKSVVRCDYKGEGSKENHEKLVNALNQMIREDTEITVKRYLYSGWYANRFRQHR